MGRKLHYAVLALALALALCGAARADQTGTLSLSDCGGGGSCPAATYTFDVGATSATLTIAITGGITAGLNDMILGVDLGFTPSNNISNLMLTANPGGLWTTTTGSLNSSTGTCGANGGAFVCASGPGITVGAGGLFTWMWTYTLNDPSNIFAASDIHIGTQYGPNATGNGNGLIVSTTIGGGSGPGPTPTPEPASVTLLAVGLVGARLLGNRRLGRA